jgi:hypothetical protein
MKNIVILSALFALASAAFAGPTKTPVPMPMTEDEKQGQALELAECNKGDIGTVMKLTSQTKKTKNTAASYTFDVKLDSGRMTKWTIYPSDPNWVKHVLGTKVCTSRDNDD